MQVKQLDGVGKTSRLIFTDVSPMKTGVTTVVEENAAKAPDKAAMQNPKKCNGNFCIV